MLMTPQQCRMARAALTLSISELSEATGIRPNTISEFERGADSRRSTVDRLQVALEARGALFLPADEGGGPGVRLKA
jgi:transcriptional regulator with XRE-family HTH domain